MKSIIRITFILSIILVQFSCARDKEEIIDDDNDTIPDSSYTQYGNPFTDMPMVDDMVMYEVNLRAFSNSGDLQGVINRLDDIRELGVNVIWLMPIHPIGQVNSVNSPYSVKDYKAVSTEYGTLNDLRALTNQAHASGMAVIMDWVANHTAWDNEWISNTGWYTLDGSGNIVHPPGTNWLDVADLNFDNTEMRAAMIDAMKYWVLEANVDGFRCDYADGVPSDFWKQAMDTLRAIPNRDLVFLAEGIRSNHFSAGFDLVWSWDFYFRMIDVYGGQPANILYTTHTAEYAIVPEGKHRLRYTTNHDESAWNNTPMVLFNGKEGALAASVATIFMGGVPLLYTGQEVGRLNRVPFFSNSPINWSSNPDMLQAYKDMMAVYTNTEAARKGSISNHSTSNIASFMRSLNDQNLLIMVNIRNYTVDFTLPEGLQNTNWTHALTNEPLELGTAVTLNNYEYLILTN